MSLRFEKVSDVSSDYCHLDVFVGREEAPFLDVSIEPDGSFRFNIYANNTRVVLTKDQWQELLNKATEFAIEEISNEEAFKNQQE